ncbi:MAG: flagellar assembly protein FliW [Oscillospiraceae bacterium]
MKINTRDFGEIEVSENDIITFVQPLYGFEEYSRFVILQDDEVENIAWLQSAETSELCFILADASIAVEKENYKKNVAKSELEKIDADSDFECWLVMVVKDNLQESTVNLKSPVIINPASSKAMQVILDENFPVRYFAFAKGKEN